MFLKYNIVYIYYLLNEIEKNTESILLLQINFILFFNFLKYMHAGSFSFQSV